MLLEHNYPVYQALEDMLAEHNRAILVTATGTGKSYVALEYLERHNLHAIVICPTIRICEDWEHRSKRVTAITYQRLCRMTSFPDSDCSPKSGIAASSATTSSQGENCCTAA